MMTVSKRSLSPVKGTMDCFCSPNMFYAFHLTCFSTQQLVVLCGVRVLQVRHWLIYYCPFAEPFFELNTTDVVESAGSAVVVVELRAAEITFDVAVTVQTITAATATFPATGNMAWHCDV